jgi:hypothetical protein
MKTDSDFDALLAGLSPEETRALQKILASGRTGDENGFPVQLALLTKAQWRTAAAVPKLVESERKLLADSWERPAVIPGNCQERAETMRVKC